MKNISFYDIILKRNGVHMIEFYGYNDARAIAAFNKRNLIRMFLIIALICLIISIIAFIIPLYELLYVWGIFFFLMLLVLFASSFNKHDDKILKLKGIHTKHKFKIDQFKLFKDNVEIKEKRYIKFYTYKNYIFLELKQSYYYIPKEELTISISELVDKIREVQFGISNKVIIEDIKNYINIKCLKG